MAQFNASQFQSQTRRLEQQLRNAQRQAEQEARRQVQAINDYNRRLDQRNREVARQVNDYNRRAADHNRRLAQQADAHNRQVVSYNREVDANNQRTAAALRSARSSLTYTPQESALVDRVRDAVGVLPTGRECDVFLSLNPWTGRPDDLGFW
jgi:chromosome segregation ATPase